MAKRWKLVAKKDIKSKQSGGLFSSPKILLEKGESIVFEEDTIRGGMVSLDYVSKIFVKRFGEEPDFGWGYGTPAYFEATLI